MDREDVSNSKVPHYGFKVKLNHVYHEKRTQYLRPKWQQIWDLLPLVLRYLLYYWRVYRDGRRVLMDYIAVETGKQIYGVPIGGIGAGSIGRGYRGEFCRFQLRPGMYEYNTVGADQFIVTIKNTNNKTIFQSVLSTYPKPKCGLKSWQWLIDGSKANYTGLYPRAWTEYDLSEYGIKLTCRQVSPVIPHNYTDSSYPCAVFIWSVENISLEERTVTIAFTFKNGTANRHQTETGECSTEAFTEGTTEGVMLYHSIRDMPCTYVLSATSSPNVDITKSLYFDPHSDGDELWFQLLEHGKFSDDVQETVTTEDEEIGCAIAAQTTILSGFVQNIEICLAWHMPEVYFGKSQQLYEKFYTNLVDNNEETPKKIANYALCNYMSWERKIAEWQKPVLEDLELPAWYKSALFNEIYFISDGGTVWLKVSKEEAEKFEKHDPRILFGRFAYLEGHEYRMYNTYDVHFYASFALSMCWPKLQLLLQYDFRDCVFREISETRVSLFNGHVDERKVKNSVPHDLGDPDEDPFLLINAYPVYDVSEWRDLNSKFVLQVFRDWQIKTGDERYVRDMYKACRTVMEKSAEWDVDADGLIENGGFPDQTFDTWTMKGASAYCGGLWLAALQSMVSMSEKLGFKSDTERYGNLLKRGIETFERKLWNGSYYLFDESGRDGQTIMADQLCGHWYLRCSGLDYEVFPKDHVVSCLRNIYDHNVMQFGNGKMGAVNGFIPSRGVDDFTLQSEESWTGVTYGVAATMIHEGLISEAWQTAGEMHKSIWETMGMAYETPEAIYEVKNYRAIGYMRPLSIWSMQLAWQNRKNKKST